MVKNNSQLQNLLFFLFLWIEFPLAGYAQNFIVSGKVIDVNNEPIIGTTITSKGSQGAVTDTDGNLLA